jgi:hypothetical protein
VRFSPSVIGNAIAWFGVCVLIATAIAISNRLGFVGLIMLGLAVAFISTMAELDQDGATWSSHVLRSRMDQHASEEQRVAARMERHDLILPLRFYRRCGFFLLAVGVLGFAWQQWFPGPG